jgi:hypothetical protein
MQLPLLKVLVGDGTIQLNLGGKLSQPLSAIKGMDNPATHLRPCYPVQDGRSDVGCQLPPDATAHLNH